MTDRTRQLTVLLDRDYRDDDVQAIKDAIGMVRGVTRVNHIVMNGSDYMAIESAKHDLKMKVFELFK